MISNQIGFYANTSQRPILKEIGLILNNKIRKWRNIRSTISRCRALFLFLIIKKICFYHPFWYEERQERGNHELLVSLRRPGSVEEAQFFSVFRSNGGKRKASARASHAREEEWKMKPRKKHLYPYAHQDRITTKNILRKVNS